MAKRSSLAADYENMIRDAQRQPGIKELFQLYGQYEAAIRQSQEYLSSLRPKIIMSATNSSS